HTDYFVQEVGGWPRILSATSRAPMTLSFLLHFDAPGIEENYEYEVVFQQHPDHPIEVGPMFQEERLSLGDRVLFHQRQNEWVHPPALVPLPQPAGQVMLGALTGLREVTIAFLILTNGLGCYAFPHNVLQETNTPQSQESGFSDSGSNFLQAYTAIALNLQ